MAKECRPHVVDGPWKGTSQEGGPPHTHTWKLAKLYLIALNEFFFRNRNKWKRGRKKNKMLCWRERNENLKVKFYCSSFNKC